MNLIKSSLFTLFLLVIPVLGLDYPNIGFKKGKDREVLKTKYPMCNEFLDVKWIDEEKEITVVEGINNTKRISKGIGKIKLQLYKKGKVKGEIYALVNDNRITYQITKKEYESKEFADYLRKIKMTNYGSMIILSDKNKKRKIHSYLAFDSLSYDNVNVCIPYSEHIVFSKITRPFKKYPWISLPIDEKKKKLVKDFLIKNFLTIESVDNAIVRIKEIDLNRDGIVDYFDGDTIHVYSANNKYQYKAFGYFEFCKKKRCCNSPLMFKNEDYLLGHGNCNLTKLLGGK